MGDDITDMDKDADEEPEYIVEGLIVKDQIAMISGASKSLKTTLLCDLVVALATGTPWLDLYHVPRK